MKGFFKYASTFVAGAVTYQVLLIVFLGSFEFEPEHGAFEITSTTVEARFADVCGPLRADGCECEPFVRTSRSCSASLSARFDSLPAPVSTGR